MRIYLLNKNSCRIAQLLVLLIILPVFSCISFAQSSFPFQGEVNSDNINLRADSTISSEIISALNKGERVDVVSELYDWYKIRLPKNAPSYIKKNMVECVDDKTTDLSNTAMRQETAQSCLHAKVLKDRVNIRLHPSESSRILGQIDKNEVINILGEQGSWFRIEPIENSFAWIHKKFVTEVAASQNTINEIKPAEKQEEINKKATDNTADLEEHITIIGVINPYGKVINRKATHKLITEDNKTFLLKGDKESLNALNYRKVKVVGKRINSFQERYPVIEIKILEVID